MVLGLLVLAAGCRTPPACPTVDPVCNSRDATLARQLVADTSLYVAHHPVHASARLVCDVASGACMLGREFLGKRCLLSMGGPPCPVGAGRCAASCLDPGLYQCQGNRLEPALVRLDIDGARALATLERLIGQARCGVDVLIYIWDPDPLGWGLAQKLAERGAALGGDRPAVRILVDGGGNLIHGNPDLDSPHAVNEVLAWLMTQPGVEVLRTRNALCRFDHRKLVVVDGQVAWSGGRNFTLSSFFDYHDVSYTLEGPLVRDMAGAFDEAWHDAGGAPSHASAGEPVLPAEGGNAWARVVRTGRFQDSLAKSLYHAVDRARHHIYLENPYFTDTILWCKLAHARRRGVDVRVVFAEDSQSPTIDRAMHVSANRLLKAGIRVYRYPGTTHVKAAAIDSHWAYLGTGNFDNLSLRRNDEIGLVVGAGPLIVEIEETLFERDFRPEWEITAPVPTELGDYTCELIATIVL